MMEEKKEINLLLYLYENKYIDDPIYYNMFYLQNLIYRYNDTGIRDNNYSKKESNNNNKKSIDELLGNNIKYSKELLELQKYIYTKLVNYVIDYSNIEEREVIEQSKDIINKIFYSLYKPSNDILKECNFYTNNYILISDFIYDYRKEKEEKNKVS
jgi:hypothetical protein